MIKIKSISKLINLNETNIIDIFSDIKNMLSVDFFIFKNFTFCFTFLVGLLLLSFFFRQQKMIALLNHDKNVKFLSFVEKNVYSFALKK